MSRNRDLNYRKKDIFDTPQQVEQSPDSRYTSETKNTQHNALAQTISNNQRLVSNNTFAPQSLTQSMNNRQMTFGDSNQNRRELLGDQRKNLGFEF
jgi:hypothetical protein